MEIKISPSDLTYLYRDCKRCFWVQHREDIKRPGNFPGVFQTIDSAQRKYWFEKLACDIHSQLPPVQLETKKKRFRSKPIAVGKVELYLSFDMDIYGKNGVQAVILDGKTTSKMDMEKAALYAPQLLAYKYGVEHPHEGEPWPDVRYLGLVGLIPEGLSDRGTMKVRQEFFPVQPQGFESFIHQVGELLSGPKPPSGNGCKWCKYRGDYQE